MISEKLSAKKRRNTHAASLIKVAPPGSKGSFAAKLQDKHVSTAEDHSHII